MKRILAIITCFFILAGCARGTFESPIPVPSKEFATIDNTKDNQKAIVKFYRSSDFAGLLKFGDHHIYADYESGKYDDDYNLVDEVMIANRSSYMVKAFTPGIHEFSFNQGIAKQTVNLEAGKIYYLAVSFHVSGLLDLEFRTQQEFDKDTKGDLQIKPTTIKFNYLTGVSYSE